MAQDPRALYQKATATKDSASKGFSFFGGKTEKLEQAAELYRQAANAYRLQQGSADAGKCFEEAAVLHEQQLNDPDEAANNLIDAFKAYKVAGLFQDAARVLSKAIKFQSEKGNIRRAATQQQNLAELYENDMNDLKLAFDAYETTANWYESDNASALANKFYLKAADIAALEGNYYKAIQYFEQAAKSSLNNNLTRWSVKDYMLKAGICHLATQDIVGATKALENYREMDPSFMQTREHQLLSDLTEAVEEGDQEKFADKLFQFDQMSKLDKWKTEILLRIKNMIEEKGEDFS